MKKEAIVYFNLFLWGVLCFFSGQIESSETRAYLSSYPRSGNHWVRFLVEEASKIATCSVYQDIEHGSFQVTVPWGGYCAHHGYTKSCRYPKNEEIPLVKTHYPVLPQQPFDLRHSNVTIRLVRHPLDAIDSYYRYLQNEEGMKSLFLYKQDLEGIEILKHSFLQKEDKISSSIVMKLFDYWMEFQTYWNSQPHVITIRYEDLHHDPKGYLRIILNFLRYQASDTNIESAVSKHPPKGTPLKHIDRFRQEDIDAIEAKAKDFLAQYGYGVTEIRNLKTASEWSRAE